METIEVQGVVALIDKKKETLNNNTDNDDCDEFLNIPFDEISTIFQNDNIPVFLEHCVPYKVGDTHKFYVKETLINNILQDVVMCDFVINNIDFIDVLRESMLHVHDIMNNHDTETIANNKIMSSDHFINSTHVKKYINKKDVFTTNKGTNITAKKALLSTFPALSLGHSVPDKKAVELSLVLAGKRPNTVITSIKYHLSKQNLKQTKIQNKEENKIETQRSDFWKVLGSLLSKKNFNRIAKVRQDQIAIGLPNEEFSIKDDNSDYIKIDFVVNPAKVSTIRQQIVQHGNTELLKNNITRKNLPIAAENSTIPITTTLDMDVVQVHPMVQGQQQQQQLTQNTTTPNSSQQQPQQQLQSQQLPGGITIVYPQQQQNSQQQLQHQQYPGYYVIPPSVQSTTTTTTNDNNENKRNKTKKKIESSRSRKRKLSYSDDDDNDYDDDNNINLSQWKRLNSTLEGLSKLLENNNQYQYQYQENIAKTPQSYTLQTPTQQVGHVQQLQSLQDQQQQKSAHRPFIVYNGVSYLIPNVHNNSETSINTPAENTQEMEVVDQTQSQNQESSLKIPQIVINVGDQMLHALAKKIAVVKPQRNDDDEDMESSESTPNSEIPPAVALAKKETEKDKTQTFSLPNSLEEAFAEKVNSDAYCFITK